nr:MAG TPA: hypothetical protein [Caudoviricetes sp.]
MFLLTIPYSVTVIYDFNKIITSFYSQCLST